MIRFNQLSGDEKYNTLIEFRNTLELAINFLIAFDTPEKDQEDLRGLRADIDKALPLFRQSAENAKKCIALGSDWDPKTNSCSTARSDCQKKGTKYHWNSARNECQYVPSAEDLAKKKAEDRRKCESLRYHRWSGDRCYKDLPRHVEHAGKINLLIPGYEEAAYGNYGWAAFYAVPYFYYFNQQIVARNQFNIARENYKLITMVGLLTLEHYGLFHKYGESDYRFSNHEFLTYILLVRNAKERAKEAAQSYNSSISIAAMFWFFSQIGKPDGSVSSYWGAKAPIAAIKESHFSILISSSVFEFGTNPLSSRMELSAIYAF